MPTAIRIKNSLLMPQYLHVAPYARLTYARMVNTRRLWRSRKRQAPRPLGAEGSRKLVCRASPQL